MNEKHGVLAEAQDYGVLNRVQSAESMEMQKANCPCLPSILHSTLHSALDPALDPALRTLSSVICNPSSVLCPLSPLLILLRHDHRLAADKELELKPGNRAFPRVVDAIARRAGRRHGSGGGMRFFAFPGQRDLL